MPGWLQSVVDWLGLEPAPGTPEHREALFRAVKAKNDERAKPPGQRDEARLLELCKRVLRLRIQTMQVGGAAGRHATGQRWPGWDGATRRRRPPDDRRAGSCLLLLHVCAVLLLTHNAAAAICRPSSS